MKCESTYPLSFPLRSLRDFTIKVVEVYLYETLQKGF